MRKCARFTAAARPWQSRRMRTCAALILLTLTSGTSIAGQAPAPSTPSAPAPSAPRAPNAPNAPVLIETPNDAARLEWEKRVAQMIRHGQLKLREEQISP